MTIYDDMIVFHVPDARQEQVFEPGMWGDIRAEKRWWGYSSLLVSGAEEGEAALPERPEVSSSSSEWVSARQQVMGGPSWNSFWLCVGNVEPWMSWYGQYLQGEAQLTKIVAVGDLPKE